MDDCKICHKQNCYKHCHKHESGLHKPEPTSCAADLSTFSGLHGVIDFACERCGVSGALSVNLAEIQWD